MGSSGIKAETWLAVRYPFQKEWIVRQKGIFSRNYADDIRTCNPDKPSVELSRDGIYEILPNAIFFTGRELLGKDESDFEWVEKILKRRLDRIKTVILPFDSSFFNHSLELEKTVNATLDDKTGIVLRSFFGDDFSNDPCPYIRMMAPMVTQAARLRGDYGTLCKAISCFLGYKTDFKMLRNRVRFIVNRPDLNQADFLSYLEELEPFFRFVEEWFVPFELRCEFKVRDYRRDDRFEGSNKLLLDYNATLGNKSHKTLNEP